VLGWRIRRYKRRTGTPSGDANVYALFTVLGKFPQMVGQMRYWIGRLSGRPSAVIEYKPSAAIKTL
jgi:hypothetical protein